MKKICYCLDSRGLVCIARSKWETVVKW